jgi:hypothetical protein
MGQQGLVVDGSAQSASGQAGIAFSRVLMAAPNCDQIVDFQALFSMDELLFREELQWSAASALFVLF